MDASSGTQVATGGSLGVGVRTSRAQVWWWRSGWAQWPSLSWSACGGPYGSGVVVRFNLGARIVDRRIYRGREAAVGRR